MRDVVIVQADETHEPPSSEVLCIAVVGDVVSLRVCRYEENAKGTSQETVAHVVVGAEELWLALDALTQSQHYALARSRRDKKREEARVTNPPSETP